jgi:hypothetical protein
MSLDRETQPMLVLGLPLLHSSCNRNYRKQPRAWLCRPRETFAAGRTKDELWLCKLFISGTWTGLVWLAHAGFAAAEFAMSKKLWIPSGYACNVAVPAFGLKPGFLPLKANFAAVQVQFKTKMASALAQRQFQDGTKENGRPRWPPIGYSYVAIKGDQAA